MNKTFYEDSVLKIDDSCVSFTDGFNKTIIPIKSISCVEIVKNKVNWWIGLLLLIIGFAATIWISEEADVLFIPGIIVLIYDFIISFKRSIYIYSHSRNYISINIGYKNVKDGAYPIITALSNAINGEDVEIVKNETVNKE
ncbi:MAG: hypothetical protein IJK92_06450 [Bacteroidales bacterium]|nr:hypothetical protein [Bacteroidales bacterium]